MIYGDSAGMQISLMRAELWLQKDAFLNKHLLYFMRKEKVSMSVTKYLRLNNGFSTSSSTIYIFASCIIHVLYTCHTLINMTYISQKNHPLPGLKEMINLQPTLGIFKDQ